MVTPAVDGIDLFKIAGRSISGTTYRLPIPKHAPFAIGYTFDGKPHSGIRLVECPDCARTRSLSPHKGVLRFPSHEKRKTHAPNTEPRWVLEKTNWDVVKRGNLEGVISHG